MNRSDRIASVSFVFVGVAAGVVTMAVPMLFSVSKALAWWLFWGGLAVVSIFAAIGVIAQFRPARSTPSSSLNDQSVTSHGQSGGITARNVNFGDDER